MSAFTNHVVHDGLDVRAEYARLARLQSFHPDVRKTPLELTIWRSGKKPNRQGSTWSPYWKWPQGRIKVNIHKGATRFDLSETLIHELAHADMNRRYPNTRVGHGAPFWAKLDEAFAEAYPGAEKFLVPRRNKFHGRYSQALRRFELFGDEPFDQEAWELYGILGQVTNETMIGGTKVQTITSPMSWAAAANDVPLAPVIPIKSKTMTTTRVATGILDERVYDLIALGPITKEHLAHEYEAKHGPYPGKSVYNSVWRLRRDGRVDRNGHLWYAK